MTLFSPGLQSSETVTLLWLLLNLVLVILTVTLILGRDPALFLSLYHFIHLLQQIKPVVSKLSREQRLTRTPLILNPYLFLCCKELHVLLIKHGRVATVGGPIRVHQTSADPRTKRRIAQNSMEKRFVRHKCFSKVLLYMRIRRHEVR